MSIEQFYTYSFEECHRVAGRVMRRELKTGGSKWLSSILEERGTIPQKKTQGQNKTLAENYGEGLSEV
jgi:hypothetical protein